MKYVLILWCFLSFWPFQLLSSDSTIIELTVKGETDIMPNAYIINFSLKETGFSSENAQYNLQNRVKYLVSLFKQENFEANRLKTENIIIREHKKYDKRTKSWVFDGFEAIQIMKIEGNDITELYRILNTLTRAEIVEIRGVQFFNTDKQNIIDALYQKTVLLAKKRVEQIAESLGCQLLKIARITGRDLTLPSFPVIMTKNLQETENILNPQPVKYSINIDITAVIGEKK